MIALRVLALTFGAVILAGGCRDRGASASAGGPSTSPKPTAPAGDEPDDTKPDDAEPKAPSPSPTLLERGIPAMTYHVRSPRNPAGEPQIPYEELRLGIYDPEARHFVPLTEPVPSALGGLLDREAGRALVLAGDLVMGEIWLVQARRVDVTIFDLAQPGQVVLRAHDVDAREPQTDRIRVTVEAALAGDEAARVTLHQLGYDPNDTASVLVTKGGVAPTPEPIASDSPSVVVDASGVFVEHPPPRGLSLQDGRLRIRDGDRPEQTFALGRGHEEGHHHVARTPDGRFVMVFTEQAGCREVAFERYVLDRIDLHEGTVTRLAAAPVHAGAALGPDGSVYLDDGARVLRFPPGPTTPVDDVLPGVRLVTPDFDRDCSI